MMDHRCSERSATRVPVLLHLRGVCIPAVIRNISRGGLFVETGTTLADNAYLTVTATSRNQSQCRGKAFDALVVHHHKGGAGLMVVDE